jgi:hypothetical protein
MNPPPDPLEKFVHDALRSLPARSAPPSLAGRVLAELVRRQNLPWWKRSWAAWPRSVRVVFLIFTASLFALTIAAGLGYFHFGLSAALRAIVARPLANWAAVRAAGQTLFSTGGDLLKLIPSAWIYAGGAMLFFIYATIFGLGATAYRTLWKAA